MFAPLKDVKYQAFPDGLGAVRDFGALGGQRGGARRSGGLAQPREMRTREGLRSQAVPRGKAARWRRSRHCPSATFRAKRRLRSEHDLAAARGPETPGLLPPRRSDVGPEAFRGPAEHPAELSTGDRAGQANNERRLEVDAVEEASAAAAKVLKPVVLNARAA